MAALCLVLLSTTAVVTTSAAPGVADPAPATNGMIAFFSWGEAAEHISDPLDLMVVNPDGTGARVLVQGAAERSQCGFDLAWSPDGNKLAWTSGGFLNVVNADGTFPTRITAACASDVTWSPDGQWLALTIWGNGSRVGLVRPDGTDFRWLRSCTWGEFEPAFSPDSATLAVVATGTCLEREPIGWGVYGFDVSTGDLKGLYFDTETRLPGDYTARHLVWSRDGSQLLMGFADSRTGGDCHPLGVDYGYTTQDLWKAPAVFDTTLTPVAATMGEYDWQEYDGSWSPDGTLVAFGATRNLRCDAGVLVPSGIGELFRMTANGGNRTRIYSAPGPIKAVINTDWQPCTPGTYTCTSVPAEEPVCNGVTFDDVIGPRFARPKWAVDGGWQLADFPNADAVCRAVWVPTLNNGFVPQGLAIRADGVALVSGYNATFAGTRKYGKNDGPCRIVAVDLDTGRFIGTANFRLRAARQSDGSPGPPRCEHGGGIHIDAKGEIWLATTDYLYRIDPDTLFTAKYGDDAVIGTVKLEDGAVVFNGSFLTATAGNKKMWIGTWGDWTDSERSRLFLYTFRVLRAKTNGTHSRTLSGDDALTVMDIGSGAQGAAFGNGLLVSYSRATCGVLGKGRGDAAGTGLYGFGPGSEEIEVAADGKVWAVHEGGSVHFQNADAFFPVIAEYDLTRISEQPACNRAIGRLS